MVRHCVSLGLVIVLMFARGAVLRAADFYVTTAGTPQGDGSAARPWDLATALTATEKVRGGDNVWLEAGTYRGGFISQLVGRADAPIVVRGKCNARVVIDTHPRDESDNGLLTLRGADVVYRDFEVTCTHPQRQTDIAGSWPADIRRGSVDVRGDRISLVNLVIHDCATGVGFWAEGEGGEISGCLIFNNGWRGPDRGHGHAIYAQNARGTKHIRDNIMFHQFAYGVHVYGSDKASLQGFEIEGNIVFDNGCLAGDNAPGIMVGGGSPASRIAVCDNIVVAGGIRLGYSWGAVNEDVACTGNYAEGLVVRDFRRAHIADNTIVAHSNVVTLESADRLLLEGLEWNANRYFVTDGRWGECAVVEGDKSRGLDFDQWRAVTGVDTDSSLTRGEPKQLRVMVRPNRHQAGRAHIAVLNPQRLPEVRVDLSQVLNFKQRYHIVSAKDVFGAPVVSGIYDAREVTLPMAPLPAVQPVGMPDVELPRTEPAFAAFVVLPG